MNVRSNVRFGVAGAVLLAAMGGACAPHSPANPGVARPVPRAVTPAPASVAAVAAPKVAPATAPKPATAAPARAPKPLFAKVGDEQGRAWKDEWNQVIADALDGIGQPLLDDERVPASEVTALCPGYFQANREEKKAFWALLFASIARLESGFDPERNFFEPRPLRTLSVGLLQLSYGDEERHPDCPLNPADANITDPGVNLRCGVAILRDQLAVKNTLFPRRFYYWSVLTQKRASIIGDFKRHKDQLGFCR